MNPGGVGGAVRPLPSLQAPSPHICTLYSIHAGLWLDKAILLSKPYGELQCPNINLSKQRWTGPEALESRKSAKWWTLSWSVRFFSQCHFKESAL
jgi:hypothetical protein